MATRFDYATAFGRNLGVLGDSEQARLRQMKIGLAGLGGAGGAHLQALLRLGVQAFHLADPDRFELANFNRQWGASLETVGCAKVETMARLAREINPDASLRLFPEGVTRDNVDDFLDGIDVAVDAIDFFDVEAHRMVMANCRRRQIAALLAAPVGFGASVLVFPAMGTSFDEHFGFRDDMTRTERLAAFAVGLGFGLTEEIDASRVDLLRGKGPALGSACLLAAAMTATEIVKLLGRRAPAPTAPFGFVFDPAQGRTIPLRRVPGLSDSEAGRAILESLVRRFPDLTLLRERERGTDRTPRKRSS
jgi:hypothetical protein